MDNDRMILAHGGASGAVDMLVGLGPVILGAVLIGAFVVLLSWDRSSAARTGWRDERPTSARLLFSGRYYDLEELLKHDLQEPRRPARPESGQSDQAAPTTRSAKVG